LQTTDLGVSFSKLALAFNSNSGIDASIGASISQAFPIPVTVKMPCFTADLYITQKRQQRRKIGSITITDAGLSESSILSIDGTISTDESESAARIMQDWYDLFTPDSLGLHASP
jgi:hypothetical protein